MSISDWANPENAKKRYDNPNNPYDMEYPFLRKKFEKEYENSLNFGVSFAEYKKGYLEGKYVISSDLESPFSLSDKDANNNSIVSNGVIIYRDSNGEIDRVSPAPVEANGLVPVGRIFFESDYEGYQDLVNMFNKVNGDDFAQIYPTPGSEEFMVYVSPKGTGGDFSERYIDLENAIALNYHPAPTKAKLLPYIHSEEDRKRYMSNPCRETLLEIFSQQLGIGFGQKK